MAKNSPFKGLFDPKPKQRREVNVPQALGNIFKPQQPRQAQSMESVRERLRRLFNRSK